MLCIITFIGSTPAYYHQWSSCFPSRNNVWKFNVLDKFSSWVQIWPNWLFVMNPLALVTFCICHNWSLMLTFFGCWWSSLSWLNFNWRFCVCTGFGDLTHFKGMRIVREKKKTFLFWMQIYGFKLFHMDVWVLVPLLRCACTVQSGHVMIGTALYITIVACLPTLHNSGRMRTCTLVQVLTRN